ncbi:E3 ubiquitin-protein ligase TRIM7-like [Hyperolius riggenbachi]|uniref:E3 ubiquitin-protein ligase TRIM7-like n=1 Tax=Hyperolius riggenbachi TaxID=752182 RepID=UPI0035A2C8EE
MAAAAIQQELKCSVCFNTYSDPTTLPCGHTFCKQCIQKTFQNSCQRCCPECRGRLPPNLELQRNTKMCSILEHLTSTKTKSEGLKNGCAYCEGLAEKLCLDCESPLCKEHLKKHRDSTQHIFTDLNTPLQSRKCPVHQELFKFFCTEDKTTICASCGLVGGHKLHAIEKISDLSNKEKSVLKVLEEKLTRKKTETERMVALVRSHKENIVARTEGLRNLVTGLIGDMKKELEAVEHQTLCKITTQEEEIVDQAFLVIKILERQMSELNIQIKEIQNLCNSTDPLTILERKSSNVEKANALIIAEDNLSVRELDIGMILVSLQSTLRTFTKILPSLLNKRGFTTQDVTSQLLPINQITKNIPPHSVLTLEGQNLDGPQTAVCASTLSSGQHYWEVEISDEPGWAVGVSYHKERYEGLGYDPDSWCFQLADDMQYKAVHDSQEVTVGTDAPVKVLAVYVDYESGNVSFYQLSDSIKHLCSMHAKFSHPLHVVTHVQHGGWIRIKK